jgi:iron complex transport system ATP-binding protein
MTSLAEARGVAIAGRLGPTDLAIERGQMVAVIGPNGGGKTSLLRGLARTEDARGRLSIEGVDVDGTGEARRRELLAFMPASRDAAWPVRVADYLAFGLGKPDAVRQASLMDLLELAELTDRPVDQLSTGERARVMLARTIAGRARLLLLDEPLSNLDPYWVLRTAGILRDEITANGSAALVSVHDLALLERFDRVLLVNRGRVVGDGAPSAIVGSDAFSAVFRVEKTGSGWSIRPADRQSSP